MMARICSGPPLAVTLTALFLGCSAAAAGNGATGVVIDPAVRTAVAAGPARVIVELRVAFRPEGALADEAAVTRQRAAIARAGAGVLSRLAGSEFRLLREYDSVPLLALEISPGALARLEHSPDLVSRVMVDVVMRPSTRRL